MAIQNKTANLQKYCVNKRLQQLWLDVPSNRFPGGADFGEKNARLFEVQFGCHVFRALTLLA